MSSLVNDAKGVAATFSSWDSCMSKAYCKWPVIAAIIVAALIVLSVLWCLFSCLCCGITLCNACVQCATCCGCCGACGNKGGRGGGRSRNKDDAEYQPMPPTPTPYQGYQPQPSPMVYNGGGAQFASYDASSKTNGKANDDALPHMPTWNTAPTRHVEDHSVPETHDMEMDRIQSLPQFPAQRMTRGAYSQLPPSSPTRNTYHQPQHNYASDIGAQRLQPQQSNDYDGFQDTPLSPAPTYYSTVPAAGEGAYRQGPPAHPQPRAGPPPSPSYYNSNSTAPYPSSRESTLFEAQSNHDSYVSRSISPPSQPSYTPSPYQSYHPPQQQESQQGVRPPSLLMVGRKPVAGSYREV